MSGYDNQSFRGTGPKALLERADHLLVEALGEPVAADRFLTAYLAGLRGADAVIALVIPAPAARRRKAAGGAWHTMARLAPEFALWSDYFAEYSALRASIMSGVSRSMSSEQADEFCSRVNAFLHDVEDHLGANARLPAHGAWDAAGVSRSEGLTA